MGERRCLVSVFIRLSKSFMSLLWSCMLIFLFLFESFPFLPYSLPQGRERGEKEKGLTFALKVSISAFKILLSTAASSYFWFTSVRRFNKVECSTLSWPTFRKGTTFRKCFNKKEKYPRTYKGKHFAVPVSRVHSSVLVFVVWSVLLILYLTTS